MRKIFITCCFFVAIWLLFPKIAQATCDDLRNIITKDCLKRPVDCRNITGSWKCCDKQDECPTPTPTPTPKLTGCNKFRNIINNECITTGFFDCSKKYPGSQYCCSKGDECPAPTLTPTAPAGPAGVDFQAIINQALPTFKFKEAKIGEIISALLPYILVLAGLGLLAYLILGGFQLMTSRGDPKAVEQAKGKITGALIGFLIIFVSYWLAKYLQEIFGLPKIF